MARNVGRSQRAPLNDVWKGTRRERDQGRRSAAWPDENPTPRRPMPGTAPPLDGTPPAVGNPPLLVQPLKLFRRHSEIQPNQMGSVNFLLTICKRARRARLVKLFKWPGSPSHLFDSSVN